MMMIPSVFSLSTPLPFTCTVTWNWADANYPQQWVPATQYWGTAYSDHAVSYYSRLISSGGVAAAYVKSQSANGCFAEAIVFYDASGVANDLNTLPTHRVYPQGRAAVFRSPWTANISAEHYLGAKAGDASWDHNHLDHGSFVFDYAGTRFSEDMGVESYALPGPCAIFYGVHCTCTLK